MYCEDDNLLPETRRGLEYEPHPAEREGLLCEADGLQLQPGMRPALVRRVRPRRDGVRYEYGMGRSPSRFLRIQRGPLHRDRPVHQNLLRLAGIERRPIQS